MGVLIWLFLALIGTALIIGGLIIFFLSKGRLWVRGLAGAATAVGIVAWLALLFTLPVSSTSVEYHYQPLAVGVLNELDLTPPPESRVRSSSESLGTREGQSLKILETNLGREQLTDHYRRQIQQAGWKPSPALENDEWSVLTWSTLDQREESIRGTVIITAAGQDRWMVSSTYAVIPR